jgi:histidine triad (HIT) family protein
MYSHEPPGYICPFCLIAAGTDDQGIWTKQSDVVYRSDTATAFISARWWPNNAGHVIIIPNQHIENIYVMPQTLHGELYEIARRLAIAMKQVYHCDGTSTRQHNEPGGYQEIWHFHLHVFPRYENDDLYILTPQGRITHPEERVPYANRLRAALE